MRSGALVPFAACVRCSKVGSSGCRLVQGHNLRHVCQSVYAQAVGMEGSTQELQALGSWTTHLAMHVLYHLAVVCSRSHGHGPPLLPAHVMHTSSAMC